MSGIDEVPEVSPETAHSCVRSTNGIVLDVREPDELQQISVDGAMHIPLGDLQFRVEDVPRDKQIYVLCHVGQRSAIATQFLRQTGHGQVWNVRGGIIGWVRAGLPAVWPGRD